MRVLPGLPPAPQTTGEEEGGVDVRVPHRTALGLRVRLPVVLSTAAAVSWPWERGSDYASRRRFAYLKRRGDENVVCVPKSVC